MFANNGSNSARGLLVVSSGAETLSATQLIDFIKKEGIVAYWLGPISGSKYTVVTSDVGKVTISYLSGGLGIDDANQRNLVIETVENEGSKVALLAENSEINNGIDSTVTGNTFSYSKNVLDHMSVQIKGSGRHVFVVYPQTRSAISMQTDAEALMKIT